MLLHLLWLKRGENMFRVCTAEEMRKTDRDCIEIAGIPGIVLMENAARGGGDE